MTKYDKDKGAYAIAADMSNDMRKMFKLRLKELNLTRTAISKKMGKSPAGVSVLLREDSALTLPMIIQFCQALNLDMNVVITRRDKTNTVEYV